MNQNQDLHNNRTRKQKTVLILSVITCLFMGVMGYELANNSTARSENESQTQKFTILGSQSQKNTPNNDQRQYASMHAQNQHLTNKVIALKEHALEVSRRLHTIQLSVFAAIKSHDESILQEMQVKLDEKERLNNLLQTNLSKLEHEVKSHEFQATNMEDTIDHLSEMVELQRKNKEKALADIQTAAVTEKTRLLNVIHELELSQTQLRTDIQKQSAEIAQLEENLSQYKFFASENEEALLIAVREHEQKQNELLVQTENLAHLLNLEEIAVQNLQSELLAFQENDKNQALERAHEAMIHEDLAHFLISDVTQKEWELNEILAKSKAAEAQIKEQHKDIAHLKEQRTLREQEILQENALLLADIHQKEEDLSLSLSKFYASEMSLDKQNQELEMLKEHIEQHEQDLAQIRAMASEQMGLNDQLVADIAQKQDELAAALIKFEIAEANAAEQHLELVSLKDQIAQRDLELTQLREKTEEELKLNQQIIADMVQNQDALTATLIQFQNNEIAIQNQFQEIFTLKEMLAEREQVLTQVNETLLADIAQKEESLSLALAKYDDSEVSFSQQTQEIAALKEQVAQRELELVELRVTTTEEIKANQQLIADMVQNQDALTASLIQFQNNEIAIQNQFQEIFTLKEMLAEREQVLTQVNETLLADIAQKEETLSLALAKQDDSEVSLNQQSQEIATLKEQIAQREFELAQLRETTEEELKSNQQLIADMVQNQDALTATLVQFQNNEIAINSQNQELLALKEQLAQREQILMQVNETLLADITEKEENLILALAKSDSSEISFTQQNQELATLKEQIAERELELAQVRETAAEDLKSNQQLIAAMVQKQDELTEALVRFQNNDKVFNEQYQEMLALNDQTLQREQVLMQVNDALLAEIAKKEESLSLALAQSGDSEANLSQLSQEIAALKEQMTQREIELVQVRETAAEELKSSQQHIAAMVQRQDELTEALVQFQNNEKAIHDHYQEILTLNEQMAQREQALMQVNDALLADIAQKEESLSLALAQSGDSEANLNQLSQEIAALKEQMAQREQVLMQVNDALLADIAKKEESLSLALAQSGDSEANLNQLSQEIATLKEQMTQREQTLIQVNDALLADIAKKEESLSLALAQSGDSEANLNQLSQEIAALKEQMAQREQALMQVNDALLADIATKEESLSLALAQSGDSEANLNQLSQEIATLKEQMAQREQALMQVNDALLADIAQKEESLSLALAQSGESETNLNQLSQEIATLKEQMAQREQALMQVNDILLAEITQKEESLSLALAQSSNSEASLNQLSQEIAALKEQTARREQALMQVNEALLADIAQKEESLSLALEHSSDSEASLNQLAQREQVLMQVNDTLLAEIAQKEEDLSLVISSFDTAQNNLNEQMQAVAVMKKQIAEREQELITFREERAEETKDHLQLLADMTAKQDQLTSTIAQFNSVEANMIEQREQINSLKEEMAQREQVLMQVNDTLLADIAKKEENLSEILSKFANAESQLKVQNQELAALQEQILENENIYAEMRDSAREELNHRQELLSNLTQKQEELATTLSLFNNAEMSLNEKNQEILSLKEQITQIENQYQEILHAAVVKNEETDVLLSNRTEQLQNLNEQLETSKEAVTSATLTKTELSNELKNLQHELITAFGKIEEMDNLARNQRREIEFLATQLEKTKETATAADSQKNVLMEELINYKDALVNALTNYENEQKRASTLEQQLSSYLKSGQEQDQENNSSNENSEDEDLRSFMNQEGFDDQALLESPLLG